MPDSTIAMTTTSSSERDAPRQVGRDEAADQRPDGGRDRRRRADERVDRLLRRALEVAVDERLHRRQEERRAEAADDRPEDDDRREALRQRHRQRADRVRQQAEDVRPLAPDEVADLAADQDERGGDERLERDRRLDAADGRAEVVRPPPRSTRSSATCRRRARTSPSPAGSGAACRPPPPRARSDSPLRSPARRLAVVGPSAGAHRSHVCPSSPGSAPSHRRASYRTGPVRRAAAPGQLPSAAGSTATLSQRSPVARRTTNVRANGASRLDRRVPLAS